MADELTDEEVFGGAQQKELSDEEVFSQPSSPTAPAPQSRVPESPSTIATESVAAAPDLGESAKNLGGAVEEFVKGVPQMVAALPGMAYQGAKFAAGGPQERTQVLGEALKQGVPMGVQTAEDVQSPLGSKESFRGLINLGMMAAPAVGELGLGKILFGEKAPPVQTGSPSLTDVLFPKPKEEIPVAATERTAAAPLVEQVNEGLKELGATPETPPTVSETVPSGTGEAQPKIVGAAIQDSSTGKTFTGPSHPQIYDKFPQIEGDPGEAFTGEGWNTGGNYVDGFVDQNGKFYDREEAGALHGLTNEASMGELEAVAGKISDKAPYKIVNPPKEPSPVSQPTETTTAQPLTKEGVTPEARQGTQTGAQEVTPAYTYVTPEAGAWWEKAGELQDAYHATKPGTPERAAARKAFQDHQEQVQGSGSKFDRTDASGKSQSAIEPGLTENEVRINQRQGTEAKPPQEVAPRTPPTAEPAAETPKLEVQAEKPPVSTKNEYTEAQRAERGFTEAEQAAKRDFGTVWDESATQAKDDPGIGRRLVNELNNKPREVSDTENAHLLRTQIETQTEHSSAVEAVNSAKTPEDLAAAKSRLELARKDLQDVYDATKSAGTKSGQALASRQMLAKEDYTLASMESRRRAANDGKPLSEEQLGETKALHEQIADLQSKLDAHEVAQKFNTEFNKLVSETRKEAKAAKATTKFNEFMDRKADEARQRIVERRGRLTTGFDPTMIADEAIIGASHIAKGITKFADWSVKMVDEFGDAVRPFLKEIWEKARSLHSETGKEYGEKGLARYKTYLSKQTEQIKGKIEAKDFTKAERQRTKLDAEAFTMRADLQKLKNQFDRGVAKEAYQKKTKSQKFWDHFVGVERGMKLSGPEVFGKLGVAAATREAVLAPAESAVGYGASKLFPRLTAGTKYGADLSTVIRAELKAKAALFTKGMREAAQNVGGKETELEAISGKGGARPEFWYNRIGKMHAAIKAPVKRAEFTRSLEQRMDAAVKAGEDIHHPEVMTRLANEAVMDANRAIFQQNTVVSSFFSVLDRQSPVAGRVARFLFPVVKIPVNIFKEVVTYHAGAPVAAAKIGRAYMKGVETLPVAEREAIIRQLTKGSVGGAALLWGYFNSDKVRDFFNNAPPWFNHTPIAMVLNEGSYLKKLGGHEDKEGKKQLGHMAKSDIPFMYTITDITKAIDSHQSNAFLGWINNMVQSTTVPQLATQVAKATDKTKPFPSNLSERPKYRVARDPVEAVKLGVPGLRQTVPEKQNKTKSKSSDITFLN